MDEASRSGRASSSCIQTVLDGYITVSRRTTSAHTHTGVYCHHMKKIGNHQKAAILARLSGARGLCAQKMANFKSSNTSILRFLGFLLRRAEIEVERGEEEEEEGVDDG